MVGAQVLVGAGALDVSGAGIMLVQLSPQLYETMVGTPQVEVPELNMAVYEVVETHSLGPVHAGLGASVAVALGAAVATVADSQVLWASEKVKVNPHDGSGAA